MPDGIFHPSRHRVSVVGAEDLEVEGQQRANAITGSLGLVLVFIGHKREPFTAGIGEEVSAEYDPSFTCCIERIVGLGWARRVDRTKATGKVLTSLVPAIRCLFKIYSSPGSIDGYLENFA